MGIAGKLTDKFRLPEYAQAMCYIVTAVGTVQAHGPHGNFTLENELDSPVSLKWATPDGPTLAHWAQVPSPHQLNWDGRIKVGGFIERLHARELGGLEVVIAEIVGGCFPVDYKGLPSLDDMRNGIFARPAESEPLAKDK